MAGVGNRGAATLQYVLRDASSGLLTIRETTNLDNAWPAWLDNAHRDLDAAVAAAYGWPADLSEEDMLGRLLALNVERAKRQ